MKPVEPVQINIYQSSNFRKDLSCYILMSQGFKRGTKWRIKSELLLLLKNKNFSSEEDWILFLIFLHLRIHKCSVVIKNEGRSNEELQAWCVIEILFMQGWTATKTYEVKRKRNTKKIKHTWNLFRKKLQLKFVC